MAATGVLPEYQPREPSCSWRWCLGYEEDTVVSRCGGSGGIQRGRGTPSGFVLVRQRFWVIFDSVEGSGEHLAESRFQFAPGEVVLDGTTARTAFPDANLLLQAVGSVAFDHAHIEKGQEKPRSGWYSDSYGKIEPAPALSLSVRANLPWRAATLLFPYRGIVVPQATFTFQPGAAEVEHPHTGQVTVKCSLP